MQEITQIALVVFGVGAVYLSQSKDPARRKWAPVAGLLGQPFWFIAAYPQPGMLIVVTLYTGCWIVGLKNSWHDLLPTRAHPGSRRT